VKVAVHTIALNEAGHVERWAASAADADLLAIADTGSTDGTADVAADHGVRVSRVHVDPFRFDTARNAALAALPADVDVVVTVDMDEVLVDGWRPALERAYAAAPFAARWSYEYVWSWVAPGVPDVRFTADRCHTRDGWRWHGAVHEVLTPAGPLRTQHAVPAGFTIEHHPDATKSRAGYLALLAIAVDEEPHNPRQRFYLAREHFYRGDWNAARDGFVEYLAMPEATWPAERAEAYRYIADMDHDPERWLLHAIAEDPGRRDAVVDLVDLYRHHHRDAEAAGMAARALRITTRPGDYMTTARVWDDERLRAVVS